MATVWAKGSDVITINIPQALSNSERCWCDLYSQYSLYERLLFDFCQENQTNLFNRGLSQWLLYTKIDSLELLTEK